MGLFETDVGYDNVVKSSGRARDEAINNYLYLLNENLRYAFANIGIENFGDGVIDELAGVITKPVYVKLEDELTGRLATFSATLDRFETRVSTAEGNAASAVQTAEGFETRVYTLEGYETTITQSAAKINLLVTDGSTASSITLTENAIDAVAGCIDLSGYVTFSSLLGNGTTEINGNNITTGKIKAINIEGCNYTLGLKDTQQYGSIKFAVKTSDVYDPTTGNVSDVTTFAGHLQLYNTVSYPNHSGKGIMLNTLNEYVLKLKSGSDISIECAADLYINSGTNNLTSNGGIHLTAGATADIFVQDCHCSYSMSLLSYIQGVINGTIY